VNVLFCDVDTGYEQPVALYKYELSGPEVDTLDPWIEVRGGG
jgi:hypothetical protein